MPKKNEMTTIERSDLAWTAIQISTIVIST